MSVDVVIHGLVHELFNFQLWYKLVFLAVLPLKPAKIDNFLRIPLGGIQDEGGGGQNISIFVHTQGIKTVYAGGGGRKWQNSVHVVVVCPPRVRVKNAKFFFLHMCSNFKFNVLYWVYYSIQLLLQDLRGIL